MATEKKTWRRPELVVLVRGRPEEAVLAACKSRWVYGAARHEQGVQDHRHSLCANKRFVARASRPAQPGSHCAFRTSSLIRWIWPRPKAFTSQPSSKYLRIFASSRMPKQSTTAN